MHSHKVWSTVGIFGTVALAAAACSSSSNGTSSSSTSTSSSSTSGSSSSSSSGGTGGGASSSTASSSSSGSTSSTSSSSSSGSSATCLAASSYDTLFTITDTTFCAVAVYTANEALQSTPSWGNHGGPLTYVVDTEPPDASLGGLTLERWTAPTGSMGMLAKTTADIASAVPSNAYPAGQANDLPFFGWTTVSWGASAAPYTGALEAIASGAILKSYPANGIYWVSSVSGPAGQGRLLYTGLSALGNTTASTNGFYAADACSAPNDALGAGTGCSASQLIDAWGDASGPVAVDAEGNAFVVLTSFANGNQEARGYASGQVARGAAPVKGTTLFTIDGFSGGLAALAPSGTTPGLVVFQPFQSADGGGDVALDVIEQAYTVSNGAVAASGSNATLLTVPAGSQSGLALLTDAAGRLWVGASGASTTTYVVLQRTP